jgi:predicted nucleotidyltransferase
MGSIVPIMGIDDRPATPTISIADALFTRVQQRVLALLFGNTHRSFLSSEIIRLAASGSGAVQRELLRLEGAGLVSTLRVGRQKHYRANAAAAVFAELRSLILKTSGLVDQLRVALASTESHIRAAFVFGSVAKQEDDATSDIDLMIISDRLAYGEVFSLLEQATVLLGRTVNPTLYSSAEWHDQLDRRTAFVTRVRDQPKLWVIGSDDDLRARESGHERSTPR